MADLRMYDGHEHRSCSPQPPISGSFSWNQEAHGLELRLHATTSNIWLVFMAPRSSRPLTWAPRRPWSHRIPRWPERCWSRITLQTDSSNRPPNRWCWEGRWDLRLAEIIGDLVFVFSFSGKLPRTKSVVSPSNINGCALKLRQHLEKAAFNNIIGSVFGPQSVDAEIEESSWHGRWGIWATMCLGITAVFLGIIWFNRYTVIMILCVCVWIGKFMCIGFDHFY